MAKVLIVGGAGFIGSHMVAALVANKYEVVVYDNLVTGYQDAVLKAQLVIADLADRETIEKCFSQHRFDAVMHFASSIHVGESFQEPAKYYQNNTANGLSLLDTMKKFGVKRLIFSSSAAVYGEPQFIPIDINHLKNPLNPYGRSKWMFEQILQDYDRAYDLKYISLRYFNAAGADPDGQLGERHVPETHLIPLALQVASGKRKNIEIFGDDYPTKDGTCIRDYIHVIDLCEAHLLALNVLLQDGESNVYNLGNGVGYSVLEVIKVVEQITGREILALKSPRRLGDPAVLIADAKRAIKELNWHTKYSDLVTIIKHAWSWECKRPK